MKPGLHHHFLPVTRHKHLLVASMILLTLATLLARTVILNFHNEHEGLFLLKGADSTEWLEITDDLVPEDLPRLIWEFPWSSLFRTPPPPCTAPTCMDFRWNAERGSGFIRNSWSDGSKLVINLGHFKDSSGRLSPGLFVGGGLPPSDPDYHQLDRNETGMAYYDGNRWYHIWCNANEALTSPATPFIPSYPANWAFKGSWIRESGPAGLVLQSSHEAMLDAVPLGIDRFVSYRTGNRHITLTTRISNNGSRPVTFNYHYGDEPWLGDFGSSGGDVGWMEHELLPYEQQVDTNMHRSFGMYDFGNLLAGETGGYTGVANFIQWETASRPDNAYISNFSGGVVNPGKKVPLMSPTNRFIGLEWKFRTLQPGESFTFPLALGMAAQDGLTGFPVKPPTDLDD